MRVSCWKSKVRLTISLNGPSILLKQGINVGRFGAVHQVGRALGGHGRGRAGDGAAVAAGGGRGRRPGRVAAQHLAYAGNQFDLSTIRMDSGPAGAKWMHEQGVDIVLLTPV